MMRYLSVCIFITAAIACSKSASNSSTGLIGKWKLTESLNDPGNGSGTWMKVNSDDYIVFTNDSTVLTSSFTTGDITHFKLLNDSTIIFINPTSTIENYFKITGNQLTLTGGCIETCGSKFIKVY